MEIKDIEKLADLAKIELTMAEKENLLKDLDGILDYVKQVEAVEIPIKKNALGNDKTEYVNKNVWREDEVKQSVFSPDLIISQFPDSQDSFVKVKKIL